MLLTVRTFCCPLLNQLEIKTPSSPASAKRQLLICTTDETGTMTWCLSSDSCLISTCRSRYDCPLQRPHPSISRCISVTLCFIRLLVPRPLSCSPRDSFLVRRLPRALYSFFYIVDLTFIFPTVADLRRTRADYWWSKNHFATALIAMTAQYMCYTPWIEQTARRSFALVVGTSLCYGLAQRFDLAQAWVWRLLWNALVIGLPLHMIVAAIETAD